MLDLFLCHRSISTHHLKHVISPGFANSGSIFDGKSTSLTLSPLIGQIGEIWVNS